MFGEFRIPTESLRAQEMWKYFIKLKYNHDIKSAYISLCILQSNSLARSRTCQQESRVSRDVFSLVNLEPNVLMTQQ
jgi:hypothetical protein